MVLFVSVGNCSNFCAKEWLDREKRQTNLVAACCLIAKISAEIIIEISAISANRNREIITAGK